MKRKQILLLVSVLLLFWAVRWLGVGFYSSGSAVADLTEQLAQIHGEPYSGREVENGSEDMEFLVTPDSFFCTNYQLRGMLGWDYRYRCQVIYRIYQDGQVTDTKEITYVGIDPMGPGKETLRAYLKQE